jgi:hypothetical protein
MATMRTQVGARTARRLSGTKIGVAAACVGMLLASGCDAGKNAETSREAPEIPGADPQAGPIALRDLIIPFHEGGYPAGSDVPLAVRLFSTATQPVRLVQVAPGTAGTMTVQAQQVTLCRALTPLVVPAEGYLLLVPGSGPYLVARKIRAALPYGAAVPVRFSFSTGNSVQVDVPMAPPTYPVAPTTTVRPAC